MLFEIYFAIMVLTYATLYVFRKNPELVKLDVNRLAIPISMAWPVVILLSFGAVIMLMFDKLSDLNEKLWS